MNFKQFGRTANLFDLSTLTKYGATSSFSIDGDKVTMFGSSGAGNYYYPNIVYDAGTYTFTFSANNNQSYFVMASNSDLNNAKINNVSLSANQPAIASNLGYGYARYLRPQSQNLTIYSDVSFIICFAPTIENYVVEDIELTTNSWHDTPHYIHNTSTDTLTTLPAVIYANDNNATVGLKGNMVQSSQPSPDSPIMPQGTGERTGNLCPDTGWRSGQYRDGVWETTNTRSTSDFFPVSSNQYRLKINAGQLISFINFNYFDNQKQWLGNRTTLGMQTFSPTAQNIVIPQLPSNAAYMSITIRFYNDNGNPPIPQSFIDDSNIMVSEGTSEPSYEPYGYKIPISSANTTTPVYLGEVHTTRKIKKLVLTGEENWKKSTTYQGSFYAAILDNAMLTRVLCTHAEYVSPISAQTYVYGKCGVDGGASTKNINLFIGESSWTTDDFKSYLQQQYAAGTPVTVWYVLATEETGIVNEPLRKIGEYGDTLSNVSIPTTAGANTISISTTLQPSEVSVNYHGWHPVQSVHEFTSNYTIATMQALTIAQLQTHTISDLQGGEWS